MWYQLNSSRSWVVLIAAEIPRWLRCCQSEEKGNLTALYGLGCFPGAAHWRGRLQSGQGGEEPHVWWWTGMVLTQDLLPHGKRQSHVDMACAGMGQFLYSTDAHEYVAVQRLISAQGAPTTLGRPSLCGTWLYCSSFQKPYVQAVPHASTSPVQAPDPS